jgi:hypothetical protein
VAGRLEARLYANSYAWRQTTTDLVNGRGDLSFAMAAMLVTYQGIRPVTTVILRLDTPTGSLPGREHSWRPSGRAVLGWELPGRIALLCNVGLAQESLPGNRERPDGGSTHYVHGGITYLIRPGIHADVHGGVGFQSAGSPRWIGVGVRQRL